MVVDGKAGEQEDVLDDFQGIDLDIDSLVAKFIRPIDRYRSHNSPSPNGQLRQPGLPSQKDPQESRTHAFYRMLGLPVIAPNGKFFNPGFNPLVGDAELRRNADVTASIPTAVKNISALRETISRRNFGLFTQATTDAAVFSLALATPKGQRQLAILSENSQIANSSSVGSLTNPPKQIETIPIRNSFITSRYQKNDGSEITNTFSTVTHILAPFMCDPIISSSVNLSPNSGSSSVIVAAPFLSQDQTEYEKNKYARRPGIEFILRLRLRQQNIIDVSNVIIPALTALGSGLDNASQREVAAAISGIGVSDVDVEQVFKESGRIEVFTLNSLLKTYKGLVSLYRKNIQTIERNYKKIIWAPISNIGGPEQGTKVSTTVISPKRFLSSWELEYRIFNLEVKSGLVKRQMDIGESSDGIQLNFSDFTISEYHNLAQTYNQALQDAKNERSRIESESSAALRAIEFISGEVSGLGLIDIIAIYMALWSVPISTLLDLIDDGAAVRLNRITELKTVSTQNRADRAGDATGAYATLANQIQTILSYGDRLRVREDGSPNDSEGGDIPRAMAGLT